jgi:hypothetical protein
MAAKKHPLWFAYPRLLVLQVAAVGLWIGSFLLFVGAEQEFFGMRGWNLLLLVQGSGLEKVAAVLYLLFPLSYLVSRRSYRLAAATAALCMAGAVVALANCWSQPVSASFTYALGPLAWLASGLLVAGLWTAAAVLDRTDRDFHRRSSLPGDRPQT